MNTFEKIFQFPKLQNSYIFKYEDIDEMLNYYDIKFQEFKIIAEKLNIIGNLYTLKQNFKNGVLTMDNGVKFSFNKKTLMLDKLKVLESYDEYEDSNTVIFIDGFPLTKEQDKKIKEFSNKKDQKIFQDILDKYNIDITKINPIYQNWTPEDLVKYLKHSIYTEITSKEALTDKDIANSFDKKFTLVDFIIPDIVIEKFADFLKISVEKLIQMELFQKIIHDYHNLIETETRYGFEYTKLFLNERSEMMEKTIGDVDSNKTFFSSQDFPRFTDTKKLMEKTTQKFLGRMVKTDEDVDIIIMTEESNAKITIYEYLTRKPLIINVHKTKYIINDFFVNDRHKLKLQVK